MSSRHAFCQLQLDDLWQVVDGRDLPRKFGEQFRPSRIRNFMLAVIRSWGVLASVAQQALDLNSQEVWATATAEQCVATTRTGRWKFTCRELESNHPQSVIIF